MVSAEAVWDCLRGVSGVLGDLGEGARADGERTELLLQPHQSASPWRGMVAAIQGLSQVLLLRAPGWNP